MFRRKSSAKRAKRAAASRLPTSKEVRGQVAGIGDDLGDALESARDAISRAISTVGQRGAEAGTEAGRRTTALGRQVGRRGAAVGGELGRKARKRAREVAREAAERLPEPEQVAELARRAEEKLLPESAKQHRKSRRKRARRRMAGAAGVAGLGMLAGWLTAPKKGGEVRQAIKERASAASGKVAEMRASGAAGSTAGTTGVGPSESAEPPRTEAEVTPIHQGDGSQTSKQRG